MKIVINACYGGFGISEAAQTAWFGDLDYYALHDIKFRTNETLIYLLETRGSKYVSGMGAELAIVEIPDNLAFWNIREYDGYESIEGSMSPILRFHANKERK